MNINPSHNGAATISGPISIGDYNETDSGVMGKTVDLTKELVGGFVKNAYKSAKSMIEPYYLTQEKRELANNIAHSIIENRESLGVKGTAQYQDALFNTIKAQSNNSVKVEREVGKQLEAADVVDQADQTYDNSQSASFKLLGVAGPRVHVYGVKEGDGLLKNAWNVATNPLNTYRGEFATAGFQAGAALGGVGAALGYVGKVATVGGGVTTASDALKKRGINNTAVDLAGKAVSAWAYSPLLGAVGLAKEAAYHQAKKTDGVKKDVLNLVGNLGGLGTAGFIGYAGVNAARSIDLNGDGQSDLAVIVDKTMNSGSEMIIQL